MNTKFTAILLLVLVGTNVLTLFWISQSYGVFNNSQSLPACGFPSDGKFFRCLKSKFPSGFDFIYLNNLLISSGLKYNGYRIEKSCYLFSYDPRDLTGSTRYLSVQVINGRIVAISANLPWSDSQMFHCN